MNMVSFSGTSFSLPATGHKWQLRNYTEKQLPAMHPFPCGRVTNARKFYVDYEPLKGTYKVNDETNKK
jgi:hypothetical protein